MRWSTFWWDLKVDVLTRSIAETLDLGWWYRNLQLNELGMRDRSDSCIASDRVDLPANDIEDKQSQRLDNIYSQWASMEEEQRRKNHSNDQVNNEKHPVAPTADPL